MGQKWYWLADKGLIDCDEYQLTIARFALIERLKVRIFLMAKGVDGGKEIRTPLSYRTEVKHDSHCS